ncbi:MAG: ABC transporter substrate-binding protein [Miltoncostaeaceae bacterium]
MRILLLAAVAALIAVSLAACGDDDPPEAAEVAEVDLILDWFPNIDHMGVYGAIEQGYFAEEGLEVNTVVPSDPAAALKQVANGRAPFAISYEPEVLLARAEGIPVQAVAAVAVHPLNSIIVRSDRGIGRPRDLEGKTVGATGLPSDRALLETAVRADGGDPTKVMVRSVGFNLAPALAAGRVDALIGAYWNIEVPEIESKGVEVDAFRLEESGVPDYDELVVVTSDEIARDDPELIRRFLRALRRGQDWAGADIAGAVDAVADAGDLPERDVATEQARLTAPLLSPSDQPTLSLSPTEWSAFAGWMRDNGLLDQGADVEGAVTDAFLPEGE